MKLLKSILVAIDFTESSERVLENSIAFAKKFQSELTVIHVLPDDLNNKVNLLVEKSASSDLKEVNDRINSKGIKTGFPILEYGNYCDRIVAAADKINANLVIVGSGERRKNTALLLGSTAEKIIRKSNKPVFVVKSDQRLDIKNIICPVDFSEESKRALKTAIITSRIFNARLVILTVYTLFRQTFTKLNPVEINEQRKLDHISEFNKFIEDFNLVDVNYELQVKGGEPAEEIIKAIKKYESDLLLMGTTGKSGISKVLMGSVTGKVIREVLCSFITLKNEDAITLEIESKNQDLQNQYATALELYETGFFQESIKQFNRCLNMSYGHIPSLEGIAKIYEKLGDIENKQKYLDMAKSISDQIGSMTSDQ